MATAREILAGKAAVEIALRDKLKAGLDAAQGRLRRFAVEVAAIGIGFDTVASIASRAMGLIANVFTGPAGQLQDLADRTGLSVQLLQTLGEVATEAGSGLEDVQTAAKGMAKFLLKAEDAGGNAEEVLTQLGLSLDRLRGNSPDQQMMTLATALAGISDPTLKAAMAAKVFGGASQQLLPILSMGADGIAAYRKQLEEAGVIRTPEQIAIADKIGDAWDRALRRLKAAGFSALVAVAPLLDSITSAAVGVLEAFNRWVADNPRVAQTLAVVFGAVVATTAALAVFTGVMLAASMVASAMATAWSIVTAGFAALLGIISLIASPLGAIIAAAVLTTAYLYAIGTALSRLTGIGQTWGKRFAGVLADVFGRLQSVGQGVLDAFSAGNFKLAGDIAMAALALAFAHGTNNIKLMFVGALNSMLGALSQFITKVTDKMKGLTGALAGMMAALGISGGEARLAKSVEVLNKLATKGLGAIEVDAKNELATAAKELDDLLAQAAKERKARESAMMVPKQPDQPDFGQQDIAKAAKQRAEFTMGTFSARMAGNFATRRVEQVWDAMQAAEERAADALEELNDKIKGGRLVVVP